MYTFILTGNESTLTATINPPIVLSEEHDYALGLINFDTYNSIPNVSEKNNKLYVGGREITLPDGTYEVADINKYVRRQLKDPRERTAEKPVLVDIRANNNSLHTEIRCNQQIDFTKPNTIGPMLGFEKRMLPAASTSISDHTAQMFPVNSISIECNLVSSSYRNNKEVHVLHQLFPTVPPGYKIIDSPVNITYLPINTRIIDRITLKVVDQNGDLVNFRQEIITIRLYLKRL